MNEVLQGLKVQRGRQKPEQLVLKKKKSVSVTEMDTFPRTDKFLSNHYISRKGGPDHMSGFGGVPLDMSQSTYWTLKLNFGH